MTVGQTFAEIWQFLYFQHGGSPSYLVLNIQIFNGRYKILEPMCVIIPNFMATGQIVAAIKRFIIFSKMATVHHFALTALHHK